MKDFIIKVKKYELGESFEIRCYERGCWQHDCYVENIKEAIERMNFLIEEYDYRADDVQLTKLEYFENITDNQPF